MSDSTTIRVATVQDVDAIVKFIDATFTKEGYGFVTSAQITTETKRGACWVAVLDGEIVGVRIGIDRVYNLCVHPSHRRKGVGASLINVHPPATIRVKSILTGHKSKKQREGFTNPEPFYESIGYRYLKNSYPKNFYAGPKNNKQQFVRVGTDPHIKIYQHKDIPKQEELPL